MISNDHEAGGHFTGQWELRLFRQLPDIAKNQSPAGEKTADKYSSWF